MGIFAVAYYKTPQNERNEVTLWSNYVYGKDDAKFGPSRIEIMFPLRDAVKDLRGREINVTLHYRDFPQFGLFREGVLASTLYTSPEKYKHNNRTRLIAEGKQAKSYRPLDNASTCGHRAEV